MPREIDKTYWGPDHPRYDLVKRFILGEEVPSQNELDDLSHETSGAFNVYSYPSRIGCYMKPKDNFTWISHFTYVHCDDARIALSFAVDRDGKVHRAEHKKGKCPFIDYGK